MATIPKPISRAVIFGVNKYAPQYPQLRGCVNDANDAFTTLRAKLFTCIVLKDSAATAAAQQNAIKAGIVFGKTGIPMKLFIANSSHGSQIVDRNADESDNKDECTCPTNWPVYTLDDTYRSIFATAHKNTMIDVFLDNCHAGTGTDTRKLLTTKLNNITIRALPPIVIKSTPSQRTARAASIASRAALPPLDNVATWAACAPDQTSIECLVTLPDGRQQIQGLFSACIWESFRINPTFTRQQHMDYVIEEIANLGAEQVPRLECSTAAANKSPFL